MITKNYYYMILLLHKRFTKNLKKKNFGNSYYIFIKAYNNILTLQYILQSMKYLLCTYLWLLEYSKICFCLLWLFSCIPYGSTRFYLQVSIFLSHSLFLHLYQYLFPFLQLYNFSTSNSMITMIFWKHRFLLYTPWWLQCSSVQCTRGMYIVHIISLYYLDILCHNEKENCVICTM